MGQPITQKDDQKFATDIDWIDVGVKTMELPPNLFNSALLSTIVPDKVEEEL